ncbi:MAG: hypothetical protein ACREB7_11500 [Sphingopyxis sp.]
MLFTLAPCPHGEDRSSAKLPLVESHATRDSVRMAARRILIVGGDTAGGLTAA